MKMNPLPVLLACVFLTTRALAGDEPDLVDIRALDPSIMVELRLASDKNILERKVYDDCRCLLQRPVAEAVARANQMLAYKQLRFKMLDCYRSRSVQQLLWDTMPDRRFIANPRTGSRHNRAAAVDVTLVDREGREVDMGGSADAFDATTFRWAEDLDETARQNRTLMEDVLKAEGFLPLDSEWWHFDHKTWRNYPYLDVNPASVETTD